MRRRMLLGCGIVSSLLYVATDILASRRYPGYSYKDQAFSELTAQGAPTRRFMVVLNVIPYDLLVAAFAAGLWAVARGTRVARLTAALLLGYAVSGGAGGGLFPMPRRGTTGTRRNVMHIPALMVQSLALMLAMGVGGTLLGKWFRYYSFGTILALLGGRFGQRPDSPDGRQPADALGGGCGAHQHLRDHALAGRAGSGPVASRRSPCSATRRAADSDAAVRHQAEKVGGSDD